MPRNLVSLWGSGGDVVPGATPTPAIDTSAGHTVSSTSTNLCDTSLTVSNTPVNPNRGLIALIGNDQATTALTVSGVAYTVGSGGGWNKLGAVVSSGGANGLEIWYSSGPSTGSVTVRATMSSTGAGGGINQVLYSVYNAPTPVDTYTSNSAGVVTISVAADGLAIAHLIANAAVGAIVNGVQDYSDLGSVTAFYYAGHNSGTNPVVISWTTNNGRGIDACRVI